MTQLNVVDAPRGERGGYKVDVNRGERLGRVSSEWFSRPADERYLSLSELHAAVRGRAERSRTRTVESTAIRVEASRADVERLTLLLPSEEVPLAPTHWSFGQLTTMVGAPSTYLRQLPAPLAAINLQYGLSSHRAEQIKTLEVEDGRVELRAVTGPDYGRIYDHELVSAVQRIAGNGTGDTRWKVPGVLDWSTGVYNPHVDITKSTTTLYASDRDVFLFLVDDINDGPALKTADVGISVDSAVDIAKESADIILLEKSLAVLSDGVVEGRKVFGNITKYIKMGASSNFGNMFSVLGASIFLPFLPMTAIQVLTNNLLYDFSQTAIPTDNVDAEFLAVPRRWDIGNITKFVLFIGPISSIFDYVTYFTMLYVFNAWNDPALFQTGWFVESLLTQTLIIHIIRTAKIPFFQSRASTALITTTLIIAAVGMALPYSWLASFLGFVPLPPTHWIAVGLILPSYVILTHVVKTWFIRRFGLS